MGLERNQVNYDSCQFKDTTVMNSKKRIGNQIYAFKTQQSCQLGLLYCGLFSYGAVGSSSIHSIYKGPVGGVWIVGPWLFFACSASEACVA